MLGFNKIEKNGILFPPENRNTWNAIPRFRLKPGIYIYLKQRQFHSTEQIVLNSDFDDEFLLAKKKEGHNEF